MGAQPVAHAGGLETGGKGAIGGEACGAQGVDQGVDGGGVPGGEVAAVEGDKDRTGTVRRKDHPPVRVVKPHLRHGLVPHDRPGVKPRRQRQLRQRGLRGHRPAFVAQRLQPAEGRDGQRRQLIQPGVGAAIGRQDRQRQTLPPGKVLQGCKAIGPIGLAPDQADQDGLRARQRLFDIGVDRHRVLQGHDIRQPNGRMGSIAHLTQPLIPRRKSA